MKRIGVCTLLLVVGSMASTGCERRPAPKPASRAAGSSAAVQPQVPASKLRVSYGSRLKIGAQQLRAQLEADLSRSATWQGSGAQWTTYQLSRTQVELTNGSDTKRMLPGLDEPFCVSADAPLRLALSPRASRAARQVLVGLVNAMSFDAAAPADQRQWERTERDVTGEYSARYTRAEGGWVERQKLRYLDAGFGVERAVSKVKLGADGRLSQANSVEHLVSTEFELDAETTLVASLVPEAGALDSRAAASLPAGYEILEVARAGSVAGLAADPPEKTFNVAYQELGTDPSSTFDAATLMATSTGIKRHPEQVAEVVERLRSDPRRAGPLSSLLVGADAPEARAALTGLLRSPSLIEPAKLEVLGSILLGSSFDTELLKAVRELSLQGSPAIKKGAINVEGDLLRRAAEKLDAETLGAPRGAYLERARQCSEPTLQAAYFAGLGYIATADALEPLHAALSVDDESLRLAALRSLEAVPDTRVDGWLAETVARATGSTRQRALSACGYRGSQPCLKATLQLLARGPETDAVAAVSALAAGRYPSSEIDPTLTKVASTRSGTLKQAAKAALGRRAGAAKH